MVHRALHEAHRPRGRARGAAVEERGEGLGLALDAAEDGVEVLGQHELLEPGLLRHEAGPEHAALGVDLGEVEDEPLRALCEGAPRVRDPVGPGLVRRRHEAPRRHVKALLGQRGPCRQPVHVPPVRPPRAVALHVHSPLCKAGGRASVASEGGEGAREGRQRGAEV